MSRDPQDHKVSRDPQDRKVSRDPQDRKVSREPQDHKVSRDLKDRKVSRDLKDRKVSRDLKETLEILDRRGQRACQIISEYLNNMSCQPNRSIISSIVIVHPAWK